MFVGQKGREAMSSSEKKNSNFSLHKWDFWCLHRTFGAFTGLFNDPRDISLLPQDFLAANEMICSFLGLLT